MSYYSILVFNPTHVWIINSQGRICQYGLTSYHLNPLKNMKAFSLFSTIVCHIHWIPSIDKINTLLKEKNSRVIKWIYTTTEWVLSKSTSHYLLQKYPKPILASHVMLIPSTRTSHGKKSILSILELGHSMTLPTLKYVTTWYGDWFVSLHQINWTTLRLTHPSSVLSLFTLSARLIPFSNVPLFLRTAVEQIKRIYLLERINGWRRSC